MVEVPSNLPGEWLWRARFVLGVPTVPPDNPPSGFLVLAGVLSEEEQGGVRNEAVGHKAETVTV